MFDGLAVGFMCSNAATTGFDWVGFDAVCADDLLVGGCYGSHLGLGIRGQSHSLYFLC